MRDARPPQPIDLTADEVRRLRLWGQRLAPRAPEGSGVARLVQDLGGVQAQDAGAAALAIRARSRDLTASDVERARVEERSIVRTWAMRGTLHLVATADLGWLLELLGPRLAAADERRRGELGLDATTAQRGVDVICDALARQGPLPRAALAAHLAAHGLPATGQAPIHLIGLAALQGLLCHGPNRGTKPTYVLVAGWATPGAALPRDAAVVALARRYLAAYGPATVEDCATWAGLPIGEVRAAWDHLAGELVAVAIAGQPAALLAARPDVRAGEWPAASPAVRLVPGYDPYLLGYRSRALAVAPEHARQIHPGGGLLHPAILVDGRSAGTWRLQRPRGRLEIAVAPFAALAPALEAGLDEEVAALARFFDQPARWHVAEAS